MDRQCSESERENREREEEKEEEEEAIVFGFWRAVIGTRLHYYKTDRGMVWGRGEDSATHRDRGKVDGEKEAVIEEREGDR